MMSTCGLCVREDGEVKGKCRSAYPMDLMSIYMHLYVNATPISTVRWYGTMLVWRALSSLHYSSSGATTVHRSVVLQYYSSKEVVPRIPYSVNVDGIFN